MIERVGVIRIPTFSGERLRAARHSRQWSQGRLAAAADVRLTTVGAWERGLATPEPPTFVAIAQALGITPGDLLTIPPEQYTLAELRVVAGLQQRDAAALAGVHPVRLSNCEAGYERLTDDLAHALAKAYGTTDLQVAASWERGRDRLMTDS